MGLFIATFKQFSLLILITMLLTVAGTVMYYFYVSFNNDVEKYKAEGKCISELVRTGVARKDIKSKDGSCEVKRRP